MTGATRQNIFKLRRSNVSGKIPTTSQLLVGELAVNTQDGFLFTAISDSGGTSTTGIRQIGWDRLSTLSGGTVNGPVSINNILSATTYYGDGSNLTGVSNGITLTIEWKFSTSTSNSDPGSGNFRYNNTIPSIFNTAPEIKLTLVDGKNCVMSKILDCTFGCAFEIIIS